MAKEWKREASVKAAIKKLGLNLMNYRTTTTMTGYSALFMYMTKTTRQKSRAVALTQ